MPQPRALLCGVGMLGLAWVSLGLGACEDSPKASGEALPGAATSGPSTAPSKVEIIEVPAGTEPLRDIVRREQARASNDGRDLFIYVGASWCEPCTRFHDAALRGDLDAVFPTLRVLELDRDRDEQRLRDAGCITQLIPLFARPTPEGDCDLDRSVSGSIKGPGAVANITPRLRALLIP